MRYVTMRQAAVIKEMSARPGQMCEMLTGHTLPALSKDEWKSFSGASTWGKMMRGVRQQRHENQPANQVVLLPRPGVKGAARIRLGEKHIGSNKARGSESRRSEDRRPVERRQTEERSGDGSSSKSSDESDDSEPDGGSSGADDSESEESSSEPGSPGEGSSGTAGTKSFEGEVAPARRRRVLAGLLAVPPGCNAPSTKGGARATK